MSESYGRLKSLVHPPGSRATQQYRISQFNTRGRGKGGRGRGIWHGVEVMVVAMVMAVVAEEYMVEVAMVKTHMNFPTSIEH